MPEQPLLAGVARRALASTGNGSTLKQGLHHPGLTLVPPRAARLAVIPTIAEFPPDPAPAFQLTSPPMPPQKKPRRARKPPVSLSDEQLLALLETARRHRQRDHVMILVTYWHGFRASETVALREADVDLGDGKLMVRRGKGSEGGWQELQQWPDNPLLDERRAITEWLAQREECGAKGGAKRQLSAVSRQPSADAEKRNHIPVKMQQCTRTVAFSPSEPETYHFASGFEGLVSETPPGGHEAPPPPSAPQGGAAIAGKLPFKARGDQNPAAGEIPAPAPSPLLFPVGRGQFWRIVHRYSLEAGIPKRKCKTHMLKHTIAKHLVRAGVPLNEIQEWMGWRSIETMNWYTRADEEELGSRIGSAIRGKAGLGPARQGKLF